MSRLLGSSSGLYVVILLRFSDQSRSAERFTRLCNVSAVTDFDRHGQAQFFKRVAHFPREVFMVVLHEPVGKAKYSRATTGSAGSILHENGSAKGTMLTVP